MDEGGWIIDEKCLAGGKPGLALADETGKTVAGLPMKEAPEASTQQ